jgi:PST family polysaccharide transporter
MSNARTVARNSLWLIAQPALLNVASLLVVSLMARHLGPEAFGQLVMFVAVVQVALPFTSLGLRQYMVRELAADPTQGARLMSFILPLRLQIAAGVSLLAGVLIAVADADAATMSLFLILAVMVQVVLVALVGCLIDALYGLERMRTVATAQMTTGLVLQLLLALGSIVHMPIEWFIGAYVIGNVMLALVLHRAVSHMIVALDWGWTSSDKPQALRHAWPFAIPLLAESVRARGASLLIGSTLGKLPLGLYGVASTLVEKLDVIQDGIGTAMYPRVSQLHQGDLPALRRLVQQAAKVVVTISTAIAVGVHFTGEAIIELIFGASFISAATALQVLALGLPFSFLYGVLYNVLNATGRAKAVAAISVGGAIAVLAMLAVLLPLLGMIGAALSVATGSVLLASASTWIYFRDHGTPLRGADTLKIATANLLMAAALFMVGALHVVLLVLCGAAVFGAAALVSRLISWREITSLIKAA